MINSELEFKLEEVLQKFSANLQEKIQHSVELLRKSERLALAYDSEAGFYLAFSGGKDSQCLYHIARLAGVKFKAHMSLTSVDPPEVIRFVKKQYPDVNLVKPKKSIYQAAIDNQILPTIRARWCCKEYKEGAGAGKVVLIGIRHAESSRRVNRNEVEISSRKYSGDLEGLDEYRKARNAQKRGRKPKNYREVTIVNATGERTLGCIRGQESLLISPIIEWTDGDVWTFLNTLQIEHCELYDQGWHRIGCIGCPMSSLKQKAIENERWPHVKRNWIKTIKIIRNERRDNIRSSNADIQNLQTMDVRTAKIGFLPSPSSDRLTEVQENEIAENIYDWWISGKSYKQWYTEKFQQLNLGLK